MATNPVVLWDDIVESYSAREFTMPGNRLAAMAALTRLVQERSGNKYLDGLWEDVLRERMYHLLWTVTTTNIEKNSSDNDSVVAPSWSWASILSPRRIKFPRRPPQIASTSIRASYIDCVPLGCKSRLRLQKFVSPFTYEIRRPEDTVSNVQHREIQHFTSFSSPLELAAEEFIRTVSNLKVLISNKSRRQRPTETELDNKIKFRNDGDLLYVEITHVGLLLRKRSSVQGEISKRIGYQPLHWNISIFQNSEVREVLIK